MKTLPSLTLGVCLLSAGAAFADNLHDPSINGGVIVKGQTGTGSNTPVSGCSGGTSVNSTFKPNNGAFSGTNNSVASGSPFNMVTGPNKVYAGAGAGNLNNPHANSQYDNACSQATLHQVH